MPVMCGSARQSTAPAAMAASTALPPSRNTSMAVMVARGCEVAAIASWLTAAERLGRWKWFIVCCYLTAEGAIGVGRQNAPLYEQRSASSPHQAQRHSAGAAAGGRR